MRKNLSKEICDCLRHAEDCAQKAAAQTDPKLRQDFLDLERSWLLLARSYGLTERLTDFSNEMRRRKADELPVPVRPPQPISDDELTEVARAITDDPIIATIEAHRRAFTETCAAYERRSAVEDELVAGVRVPAGEAENDPRWIAANDAAGEALALQDDLALKLLETQPTTIAGAAALLIAVATTQPEIVFPELDGKWRPFESKLIAEPKRDFAYFIVRNVAAALSKMAAADEAFEQQRASKLRTSHAHRALVGAAE